MNTAGPEQVLVPRTRNESGFYSSVSIVEDCISLEIPHTPYKFTACESVCSEEPSGPIRVTKINAILQDQDRQPIAYANLIALTLQCGESVSNTQFLNTCDAFSSELHRMSDELQDHAIEAIQNVLSKGGFLHLSRLEVREDMLGKGIDVHLMQAVVSLLGETYELCLMTVEAFPLQFEWAATSDSSLVPYLTDLSFLMAKEKLENYYAYKFGFVSLSSTSDHLICALPGYSAEIDHFGWTIKRIS